MQLSSPEMRRILRFGVTFAFLAFFLVSCDKAKTPPISKITAPPATSTKSHSAKLAIILDDVSSDPAAVDSIFAIPYPLTLSVLPNHLQSTNLAEESYRRGYEVMLHLPMESQANEAPEPQELHAGMNSAQIAQILGEMLQSVPHVVGVNNHQGSLATSDAKLMERLMPQLRERKLFFVDSRTTAATVAFDIAQRDGVRCGYRNVPFLDDVQEYSAIRRQLLLAIRGANEKGEAIVIGHPHAETLRVLRDVLPQVQAQGVELVHASSLVH